MKKYKLGTCGRIAAGIFLIIGLLTGFTACEYAVQEDQGALSQEISAGGEIPDFAGEPYVVLNGNIPVFSEEDTTESFEYYSELDELGRCGTAYANIGIDLMPVQEREPIGNVKPSGWHLVKYSCVEGNYLYNRCHLIGFQLAGENANERNLITGTRYMNVNGMLPFENEVAEYVHETGNHVLYRVTPVYRGDHLIADGVQMEAFSVEDEGAGVCFNVFVYNVQPGVIIDYATGESSLSEEDCFESSPEELKGRKEKSPAYVLNTNTMKFHRPDCGSVQDIKPWNREDSSRDREELLAEGYQPCKNCNP